MREWSFAGAERLSRRGLIRYSLSGASALGIAGIARVAHADLLNLDRAVVRFTAPEIGGVASPEFIFERELSFEARIEALEDPGFEVHLGQPYRERHIVVAMERHIAETLLARLPIDPEPTALELAQQTKAARVQLVQALGGPGALASAELAEGISAAEVARLLRRRARASLYLHRMVAPMLEPERSELLSAHRSAPEPLRNQPFEQVKEAVRRWYIGRRLAASASAFFQNARSRLQVRFL
ncbi:MAG: hypothetical protein SFV15_08990 [Polyangiaceae bacterium]|nr:hypothetical protein [Polyangiaceae bacterium]